jgi:carboxyl-terminal processing protease
MSYRNKFLLVLISGAIALYAAVGGLLHSRAQQTINDSAAQMKIFESVLQHIQNDYVDEPNLEKVRAGALRGLASGLDPYSSYLTPEQVRDFRANKQNTLSGIGAEFSQVSGYLYVVSVIKGSPAEKAGLKSGDVIEYIENKATRDVSLYDAKQLLLGAADSKVNLRVIRAGEKAQTISVPRGSYKIPQSEARIEAGKIGVIKVYSLDDGEAADIRGHVQEFQKQGVQKIILDLRQVAGGSISEAATVANLFIKDGTLAEVLGRENKVTKSFVADPAKFIFDGKLVAITDLGTSGASEVVASAIEDHNRGDVVGERTFGAGTEQQLFALKNGDGLYLTVAKWSSGNGKPFLADERADSGVKPTIEVKRPDALDPIDPEDVASQDESDQQNQTTPQATPKKVQPKVQEDIQMKKALELLQDKSAQKAA